MTTITMSDTHANSEDFTPQSLQQRVLLLSPTLGYWRGIYQIPKSKTEVLVSGETIEKGDVTTPRAKLMTEKYPKDRQGTAWLKRFRDIENAKNRVIEQMSVKFPIHGVRIIPKSAGGHFFDAMFGDTVGSLRRKMRRLRESADATERDRNTADQIENRLREAFGARFTEINGDVPMYDPERETQSVAYQLHLAAEEFVGDLPTILGQIEHNNKTYAEVKAKIPIKIGEMRAKFYLDCAPIEISGGTDPQNINEADLADHQDLVRAAVHRHVHEAVENMVRGPREELARALAGVQDLVASDGRVTKKTFEPVRRAIAKIRLFDCVANDDLLRSMSELERRLDATVPTSLTSTTAATNGFSAAIEAFKQEVADEQRVAADVAFFGRHRRGIQID